EQNELVTFAAKRGLAAADLRERAKRGKVRVDRAAFELGQYKGEFIGTGPTRVFADTDAFMKLQRKAAAQRAAAPEQEGRFARVTLLGKGERFDYAAFRRIGEVEIDETGAANVEVFVGINTWASEIEVEYGLPRAAEEDADEDDEFENDDEEESAAKAA